MRRALRFVPMVLLFGWLGWGLVPRRLPRPALLDEQPVPVAGAVEERTATEILERVRAAYASAATYRDEGWIRNVRIQDGAREVDSLEHFRVALARPDRLAWQWRELEASRHREDEFVDVLQHGDEVRFRATRWGESQLRNREDAFARIAARSFEDLLQLLFPGEMGGRALLARLADARLVGLERFDGHVCMRIEGTWSLPSDAEPVRYTFWIDRDGHHLRRFTAHIPIADWILESTAVFSPRAGGALPEPELALDEEFQ